VLTIDYPAAAASLAQAQRRIVERAPSLDWAGRSLDQLAPPTLRQMQHLETPPSR
jgi:hypothetical protein